MLLRGTGARRRSPEGDAVSNAQETFTQAQHSGAAYAQSFANFSFLVSLALLAVSQVWALDPNRAITQYSHQVWQDTSGLPNNTVHAIVQTPDGYMWFGTDGGLVRFDGVRFVRFDHSSTNSLRHDTVRALAVGHDGALWIGTRDGLHRLYQGRFEVFTAKQGLPSSWIWSLYFDRQGRLWVGTHAGLARFEDGAFHTYPGHGGLSSSPVHGICQSGDQTIWAATMADGFYRIDSLKITHFSSSEGLANNQVRALYPGRDGKLWIGNFGGLDVLEAGKLRHVNAVPNEPVDSITQDSSENLWIGRRSALTRLNRGGRTDFGEDQGVNVAHSYALVEDREGALWVGSDLGGVTVFRDTPLLTYGKPENLSVNLVLAVAASRRGGVWLATDQDIEYLDANTKEVAHWTVADGLSDKKFTSLYEDSSGVLWVGTGRGLNRIDGRNVSVLTTRDGLLDDSVEAVAQGPDGALWVGSLRGLTRLHHGKATQLTAADGMAAGIVNTILPVGNDAIWVGCQHGLSLWKRDHFVTYTVKDGLEGESVLTLLLDKSGSLWIGGLGLTRFQNGKFTSFGERQGLGSGSAFNIQEDASGYLWISGQGLKRISKWQLQEVASGKKVGIAPKRFGLEDGMRSADCVGGLSPTGTKTADGHLWFATTKGVVTFDPAFADRERAASAPILIEEIASNRRILSDGVVPAGAERFTVRYTSPVFALPQRLRFRYRLEGYDHDWVDGGTERLATYSQVNPGRYRFRVAASADGVSFGTEAWRDLFIEPRWYQTVWFKAVCVLLAMLLAWSLYRLRVWQIRHEFGLVISERTRIARELHDTLLQGVTGVAWQIDMLSDQFTATQPKAREQFSQLLRQMNRIVEESRQAVSRMRRPEESAGLAARLEDLGVDMTKNRNIEFRFRQDPGTRALPVDVEETLLSFAREAVQNAVKHASARVIEMELRVEREMVLCTVRDDGRGFEVQPSLSAGSHFGLIGLKERAEEARGTLSVTSELGKGATIKLAFPIRRENIWISWLDKVFQSQSRDHR